MLFATVVPIAYFLLYLKNKQVTFVFLKFVMAFVICLYWATYACTFFYSYYDVINSSLKFEITAKRLCAASRRVL